MALDAKTIALALRLETGQFTAGLGMAGARVRTFAGDVKKAGQETGAAFTEAAQRSDKGFKTMSTAALVAGGAIVAGFGIAVHAAMEFDKQMSEVGAVSGATSEDLGRLRDAAIQAGAATVFSASQAAQAETELAKAGVSTSDILSGGLNGALNLASAGNLDLATAAGLAANAMTTFKLSGADVPRIADALAAGANKSAADVGDMGQALQQSGLVADQLGLTLEDTVGTLAMFAQAGLRGSDAGTSLKTMLMRLTPQSAEARQAMEDLGVSFYDASGQFVGITSVAEQLHQKLGPLSQEQRQMALQTIFGADAIRAATILYEAGGQGVDEWRQNVTDSGYAAELAGEKTDNLAGDLEQLKGSLETALIQGGSQATTALRFIAGGLTDVVNGLGAMPGPIQTAFLVSTGLVGAASLGVGALGKLTPAVKDFKAGLDQAGTVGKFASNNLGALTGAAAGLGIVLTGVSLVYAHYAQEQAAADARVKEFTDTLNANTGALTENTEANVRSQLEDNHRMDNLQRAGITVSDFTRALADSSDQVMSQDEVMARWNNGMKGAAQDNANLAAALRTRGGAMNELLARLIETGAADEGLIGQIYEENGAYRANQQILHDRAVDQAMATGKTREQAEAEISAKEATEQHTQALKDAADAQRAAVDPYYAAYRAQQQLGEAQTSYNNAVREFGDGSIMANQAYMALTDAGFGYEASLLALATAQAGGDASAADLKARLEGLKAYGIDPTTGSAEAARGKFWELAGAAEEAGKKHVNIPVTTPGLADAIARMGTLLELYQRIGREVPIYLNPGAAAYGKGAGVLAPPSANGNVFTTVGAGSYSAMAFANGGMYSERHVAHIAPAGTWRLFGEPETGGEAYIPLAPSKRTRSVSIWQETGRRLGMPVGGATYVNLGGVAIDARGATATDARAIRDAVEAGVAAGISKGKAELERSDRRLR